MSLQPTTNLEVSESPYSDSNSSYTLGLMEFLPVNAIRTSRNPIRSVILSIDQLARSIRDRGLLQPIIVRSWQSHYEIIAGNRRFMACKMLRWQRIPSHIVEASDKEAFELSLSENLIRQSLDPIDEATAYKKYAEEFGWGGIKELSQKIGLSTTHISKRISMLSLPQDVLDRIRLKEIGPTIAEELLSIENSKKQSKVAALVSENHYSLRTVRKLIKNEVEINNNLIGPSSGTHDTGTVRKRLLEKGIIALRLTLHTFDALIEDSRNDQIIFDFLMNQRNLIHSQIDSHIKLRKKCECKQNKIGE